MGMKESKKREGICTFDEFNDFKCIRSINQALKRWKWTNHRAIRYGVINIKETQERVSNIVQATTV